MLLRVSTIGMCVIGTNVEQVSIILLNSYNNYGPYYSFCPSAVDSIVHTNTNTNVLLGVVDVVPAYNAYLQVCSKGHSKSAAVLLKHAQKATETLEYLLHHHHNHHNHNNNNTNEEDAVLLLLPQPTTESFQCVLRAWTRCRTLEDMPNMVMKWLRSMEHYARNNNNNHRVQPTSIPTTPFPITKITTTTRHQQQQRPNGRRNVTCHIARSP